MTIPGLSDAIIHPPKAWLCSSRAGQIFRNNQWRRVVEYLCTTYPSTARVGKVWHKDLSISNNVFLCTRTPGTTWRRGGMGGGVLPRMERKRGTGCR